MSEWQYKMYLKISKEISDSKQTSFNIRKRQSCNIIFPSRNDPDMNSQFGGNDGFNKLFTTLPLLLLYFNYGPLHS